MFQEVQVFDGRAFSGGIALKRPPTKEFMIFKRIFSLFAH
jgi:hypothetical protein